jgi:hypothetical protein
VVSFEGGSRLDLPPSSVVATDDAITYFNLFIVYGNHTASNFNWQTLLANDSESFYIGTEGRDLTWYEFSLNASNGFEMAEPFRLVHYSKGSGGVAIHRDGVQAAVNATITDPLNNGGDSFFFIGDNANHQPLSGDIAEMIVFESAVDAASESLVKCYLASKYALTVTGCE